MWNFLALVLLVSSISLETYFAQKLNTPSISYISPKQIKDVGRHVDLVCAVKNPSEKPVMWMKNGSNNDDDNYIPISSANALIVPESRYSIRYEPDISAYTLRIKNIQETDSGFYKCQIVISPTIKIAAEVELQIRRPPLILDNSTSFVVASEGDNVGIECYADGYPPPAISWRRENNRILPTGGSIYRGNILNIKQIRKNDRGIYICVAKNGIGHGARRNIAVSVEFAPNVTASRSRIGQALHYDVDLTCHMEGYPPPTISWFKDEVALSNNQHYRIANFASDEFTETTLRLIAIDESQYGLFVCKATNKLGTDETILELFETMDPCGKANCDDVTTSPASTVADS